MKQLILAFAGLAAIGAAQAQTTADTTSHAYIGVGASTIKNDALDSYRTGFKLFGGYDFDQNLGIEAGYTRIGKESETFIFGSAPYSYTTRGSNSYIAGKYTVPINDRFSAYGKLGVSQTVRKYSDNQFNDYKSNQTGLYGALGVKYKLNQNMSVLAEYERNGKTKDVGAKADSWTLGLSYGF
jgi:opacity protein-like surface antigen